MLAAHRDQENLVHSHQVPTKQNPKTPGARYPKTPSRFNDENAPTAFAGKTGGAKIGGLEKTVGKGAGGRQMLMTPMGNPNRAVLGNKTTNAKAKIGQSGGIKGIAKDLEKTAAKPTTVQRPKQRPAEVAPIKFDVRHDKQEVQEEEEPEYAPPPVEPQPYESDVLPPGLTMEGLKNENLLRGYYTYYHDPVDENGVSRKDKQLEEEMERLLEDAAERNEQDLQDLDWTVRKEEDDDDARGKPNPVKSSVSKPNAVERNINRNPSTLTSRRAAAALSQPSEGKAKLAPKTTMAPPPRRPLSSLLKGTKTVKRTIPVARDPPTGPSAAIASRTTLGYNKGRTASSVIHPRTNASTVVNKPSSDANATGYSGDETITPARVRAMRQASAPVSPPRPQFLSIFDGFDDEEDLPVQIVPQHLLQDDDEQFELRLDI